MISKYKKPILIIAILIIIYLVIAFFVLQPFKKENNNSNSNINENNNEENEQNNNNNTNNGSNSNNNEKVKTSYLVLGDKIWKYQNNSWRKENPENAEDVKFNIYSANELKGKYYLKYGNTWNLFDDNNNYVAFDEEFYAYDENLDLTNIAFTTQNITELEIEEIKNNYNIQINSADLVINNLMTIDLNDDGNLDKLVFVSNLDYETVKDHYYNIAYANINGKIIDIIREIASPDKCLDTPNYELDYLFKIENKLYLVFYQKFFSNAGRPGYNLFYLSDNKYIKID